MSSSRGVYDAWLFDLDGTIYLGDDLLPGALDLIATLTERRLPFRFVSNNPTRTPEQYVSKLTGFGLPVLLEQVVTSVITTVDWITTFHPGRSVFPIAEAPVVEALIAAGVSLTDDARAIDIVLASFDRSFDYRKLQVAFDALWFEGPRRDDGWRPILVQTNPDRYCPYPGGRGEPDCAAITAAIEAATGVSCSASFGKPSTLIANRALAGLGIDPSRVLMVGDRLATDIALATNTGMQSALVLTGDSTAHQAAALPASQRPTHVVAGLPQLLDTCIG